MSRRHNTRHNRSKSRYPRRLRERGETSASVVMRRISSSSTASTLGLSMTQYAGLCRRLVDDLGNIRLGRRR